MAAAPEWKIYRDKEYVAACKYAEDAAALVALAGGEVRFDHGLLVWREGAERFPAGESYDWAARIMELRRRMNALAGYLAAYGGVPADRALTDVERAEAAYPYPVKARRRRS